MFRIPLENHAISVIRQERTLIFPADFLFIIAANACPCGYYPMVNAVVQAGRFSDIKIESADQYLTVWIYLYDVRRLDMIY